MQSSEDEATSIIEEEQSAVSAATKSSHQSSSKASTAKHHDHIPKEPLLRSFTYHSDVPEVCKAEDVVLGVDEAGRGPVLGTCLS